MMKSVVKEFKDFALKGNMLDMAVGLIIGAAFGGVVASLVNDILMPPIGLLMGGADFTELYLNLSGKTYDSLAAAQADGAATINYGIFINNCINFFIVAFAIFLIVRTFNRLQAREQREKAEEAAQTTKECPFCLTAIPRAASRCPHCTSELAAIN